MSDEYVERQRAINWIRSQLQFERMLEAYRNQPEAEEAREAQDA